MDKEDIIKNNQFTLDVNDMREALNKGITNDKSLLDELLK